MKKVMAKNKTVKEPLKFTYRDMVIKAILKLQRKKKVTTFEAICKYIRKRFRTANVKEFLIKQTINYLVIRQVLSQEHDQYKVKQVIFSADVAAKKKKNSENSKRKRSLRKSNRYKGALRSKFSVH